MVEMISELAAMNANLQNAYEAEECVSEDFVPVWRERLSCYIADAVAAEREACARLAIETNDNGDYEYFTRQELAEAIRARGKQPK